MFYSHAGLPPASSLQAQYVTKILAGGYFSAHSTPWNDLTLSVQPRRLLASMLYFSPLVVFTSSPTMPFASIFICFNSVGRQPSAVKKSTNRPKTAGLYLPHSKRFQNLLQLTQRANVSNSLIVFVVEHRWTTIRVKIVCFVKCILNDLFLDCCQNKLCVLRRRSKWLSFIYVMVSKRTEMCDYSCLFLLNMQDCLDK